MNKCKEAQYIDELMGYINVTISDKDTDENKIIGYLLGTLAHEGLINMLQVNHYYNEACRYLRRK